MKKYITFLLVILLNLSMGNHIFADDHDDNYFNFQVNFCKLNEGNSMEDYSAAVDDYIKWSKKNDVEVYVARQMPLFPHDNFIVNRGYDFQEVLIGTHEVTGKAWDLWLGTKEGQELSENWQSAATCYVKWGHAYPQYLDNDALENDPDRVISWNWCSRNEGVSIEDLQAQHNMMVKEVNKANNGLSGWVIVQPVTGAAQAPGDFVHLGLFNDVESFMEYKESFAAGGWKGYLDYTENYATCNGEELFTEEVLNSPDN